MKRKLFAWMMAISFAFTNVNSFVFAEEGTKEPATTEETSQEETIETEAPEQTGTTEETVQDNEPEQTDSMEKDEKEENAVEEIFQKTEASNSYNESLDMQAQMNELEKDNNEIEVKESDLESDEELIEVNEEIEEQNYLSNATDNKAFSYTIENDSVTITSYNGNDANVVIPSMIEKKPVTTIGTYAFFGRSVLTSVVIPESVIDINSMAFQSCKNLSKVYIPESVYKIGEAVFSGCPNLKSAGPSGSDANLVYGWIDTIPTNAFNRCESLEKVTFPSGLIKIEKDAFLKCTLLKTLGPLNSNANIQIDFSELNTDIFNYWKNNSHYPIFPYLENAIIPNTVMVINDGVFSGYQNLKSVELPESLTKIGGAAFKNCSRLEELTIPKTVTYIGEAAFEGCEELKNVLILSDDVSIGDRAFLNCIGLAKLKICGELSTIGKYSFSGCKMLKTAGPIGGDYDYQFPWANSIPDYAFCGCSGLLEVIIPDEITSIGVSAFSGCENLTQIDIPESVKIINKDAFSQCKNVTEIVIPDKVEKIDDYTFSGCSALLSVLLPINIKTLGNYSFYGCSSISQIHLPEQLNTIGDYAFQFCNNLTSIEIPENVTTIGKSTFSACTLLKKVRVPESVSVIGKGAFSGTAIKTAGPFGGDYDYQFGWRNKIPVNAFSYCTNLEEVLIPNDIEQIGHNAFENCIKINQIIIPENVRTIGYDSFIKCESLENIYFRGKCPIISKTLFSNDMELNAYYPAGVDSWNDKTQDYGALKVTWIFTNIELRLEKNAIEVINGSNYRLNYSVTPTYYDYKVDYVSSDESVAEVNEHGVITAKTYGKVKITAVLKIPSIGITQRKTCNVQTRFSDVIDNSQSYYKPVYWGADNGVVAGYDGGVYFGPDNVCTRAQFVTFLWRLAGKPTGNKNVSFKDVSTSVNYYRAVKWAVSEGIIVGYKDDNTFRPDNEVTRGQVAVMLWRFAGKKTPKLPDTSPFSDVSESSNIYKALVWGQQAGVIKGYKDGTFQPDASCLRQHIVTFLYRYARDVMKKKV